MKKTMIVAALLAGAVSVYSQGQLEFNDYGTTSGWGIVIFGQQSVANSTVPVTFNGITVNEEQGNPTLSAYPQEGPLAPGTTVYASANPLAGSGYDVQALVAAGSSQPLSALALTGPVETGFYTGGDAGLWLASIGETTSVGSPYAATVAVAAWANTGVDGAATTLAQAQADGYAWGISALGNVTLAPAPNIPVEFPAAVTSFSLGVVPEPSTIALGVIGASAFLLRLRRK